MSSTTTVECDNCGRDLTHTTNSEDYRVVLASEPIPIQPGGAAVTDMHVEPPLTQPHHFCTLACLRCFQDADNRENRLRIADLVLLVSRLVSQIRRFDQDNDVAYKAMEYLRRKRLGQAKLREIKADMRAKP